ncbi:hypothetical protein RvY_11295-2 [Ramazzottius varieornatus]|uniref:Uncharacterized protein n=1 Tax=Ramazzottius varieornatus TaxID=947166 RepID=A0A1D1VHQ4_RAMVA|nr:hypothetical protein RvY_11295-2 [Ramazzottius varieornatus]
MADLYTAGVMVNSVMLSNFATIIYTSEQVALECLCRLMSAFIEKNKCSASHLKSVECYFEQLRQHYPTKLTAKYYRTYSYMRGGLDAVAASATTMTAAATLTPALTPAGADLRPKSVLKGEILKVPASVCKSSNMPTTLESDGPPDTAPIIDFSSTKNKLASSDADTNAVPARKSWAIPLQSPVSKPDEPAIFNKLVDVYEMRHRNHQRLQELKDKLLCKDAGLTAPDFGSLPWIKNHATSSSLDKVDTIQTTVIQLVEDTEKSLQHHMRQYYELVEKVTEDKIDELVESLPANSRADVNQKAYNEASLSRLL